jgi:HEAT repeat protein
VWKCPSCGYSLDSDTPAKVGKFVLKKQKIKQGELPVFTRIKTGCWSEFERDTVVSLLEHNDVNVRSRVISALIEFGNLGFIDALLDRYEKMQTAMEKKAVLDHFSKLPETDRIRSQLIALLISDLHHPKREIQIFSIARIKKIQLIEAIDDLLSLERDPDSQIRQLAEKARMKIQGTENIHEILS